MTSETEETVLDLEAVKAHLERVARGGGLGYEAHDAIRDAISLLAALARAPEAGREEPREMGQYVGDIFFGDPTNSTRGTHRWTGTEWVPLPTDVEVLVEMLADARAQIAALSPPSTGGEGEANQVGAAEAEVGRYVYRRIERLMDAKPGTVEGAELCYLAEIAEGIEEYGEQACDGHPLGRFPHPSPEMGEISAEDIAQFLHDEVDLPDKFVSGQWPLHDNDDGYRGDSGYVRLQPRDIVEHYRDAGKRLHRLILSKLKENGLSREE